ncbi:MAG TPA: molybdopterin-dependent oxidoreductase [Gaiellales bacterium]|jgi:DMSO/TMAO reductase YedYZ molybdopterin-dependent catalytic subunit|nr:molybdopterin-dependent oxidoreductase [Gaiellales bacterium]
MHDVRMGRGVFLGVVGAGVAGLFVGGRVSRLASPLGSVVPNAVRSLVPDGWRIYSVNPPWPTFDPASYRLQVTGAVEHPLSLSWDEVLALPQARQTTDFHCVTGWTVGGVHWQGVRLQDLWDRAKPTSQAKYANFVSLEQPYVDSLSMRQTTMPNVMLAHAMDSKPLTQAHGAPMRLVIPEMYGYKGVKWLTRIDLVPKLEAGFWEQRGYDVDAWVGRSNGY